MNFDSPISIYVPIHFDLSQIEYVAPFLEHYIGSKVFVYKWNGIRDKITHYYRNSPEYKEALLGVYDFNLMTILKAIFEEPIHRKVVFLLTTSMAYAFGSYQRKLLEEIKHTLEKLAKEYESNPNSSAELLEIAKVLKNKVWGVSVVGHCMYGCMSCKGNDHKVPVYFTRYFRKNIPYDKEDIKRQFNLSSKPIPVLCAPSTGETSLLLHNDILEYLLDLQNQGCFKFVWKFHPSVYNQANYSTNTKEDKIEMKNVKWIMQHFESTKENEPCLLPFLEAFQIIFCDLHSSVPFIASYFSPKTILCYWNDADYEVPAGRDPIFLSNLHVYQTLTELKSMLSKDHVPEARGDPSFFHQMYGHVDGNEVQRFATLAQWPSEKAPSSNLTSLPMHVYRHALSDLVQSWYTIYKEAEKKQALKPSQPPPDEDDAMEVKLAMGIVESIPLGHDPMVTLNKNLPPKMTPSFSIMTLNMWLGSEGCYASGVLAGKTVPSRTLFPSPKESSFLLECTARYILSANVDVVGCQECASLPRDQLDHEMEIEKGELGSRVNQLPELQTILTKLSGVPWYLHYQGIVTPGKGNRHPWGILSKYPIVSTSTANFGVQLKIQNQTVWVFQVHLPYQPYQPYQLVDPFIPYEGFGTLTRAEEAIDSSLEARGPCLQKLFNDIDASIQELKENKTIIVMGDFNEPSHLDWTYSSVIAGYQPMQVQWPMTKTLDKKGFVDCYRTLFPDPIRYPGYTWCSYKDEFQAFNAANENRNQEGKVEEREKMDRIDFIFYKTKPQTCQVHQVEVLGNRKTWSEKELDNDTILQIPIENDHYTSDHRAVIARFSFDCN